MLWGHWNVCVRLRRPFLSLFSLFWLNSELLEQDDEFLTLTAEQLGQLIASDRLAVTEDQVFEAVLRWIAHDVPHRQQAARSLCGRVRFSLLPRDYLVRLSQSEAFLMANPWCKDYLIEALSYHLLSWDEKLRVTSERAKPRTPVGLPKVNNLYRPSVLIFYSGL